MLSFTAVNFDYPYTAPAYNTEHIVQNSKKKKVKVKRVEKKDKNCYDRLHLTLLPRRQRIVLVIFVW